MRPSPAPSFVLRGHNMRRHGQFHFAAGIDKVRQLRFRIADQLFDLRVVESVAQAAEPAFHLSLHQGANRRKAGGRLLSSCAWIDERSAGMFLLTGSANVLNLPRISESLAGRMEIHSLWPLSRGERAGLRENL